MKLPSGAELIITVAPFAVSRALYQSLLEEAKSLRIDPLSEIDVNLWKDVFASALSSKKVESCLEECMKRATYNGKRIDQDTFEPVEARQDYISVCFEVTKENVAPFTKSLYAEYKAILEKVKTFLA